MQQNFTRMQFEDLPKHAIIVYCEEDLEGVIQPSSGYYSSQLLEIIPLERDWYQLRLVAGTLKPRYKTYWYKVLNTSQSDPSYTLASRSKSNTFRGIPIE